MTTAFPPGFDPRHPEPYLTKKQIAALFSVTTTTIDRRCAQGMPYYQDGGRRLFKFSECEAWMASRRVVAQLPPPERWRVRVNASGGGRAIGVRSSRSPI
jgi:excisionase family DNA binding protein